MRPGVFVYQPAKYRDVASETGTAVQAVVVTSVRTSADIGHTAERICSLTSRNAARAESGRVTTGADRLSAGGGKLEVVSHLRGRDTGHQVPLAVGRSQVTDAELALYRCHSSHEYISMSQHCLPKSRPATRRKACAYRFLARWTTRRSLTRHDALDQAQTCLLTAEVRSVVLFGPERGAGDGR
jgi:hypothetical protein